MNSTFNYITWSSSSSDSRSRATFKTALGTMMLCLAATTWGGAEATSESKEICTDMGPQTPRDISNVEGSNLEAFPLAPPAAELNLCNIHLHRSAEHKGPEFSVFVSDEVDGGYACNDAESLSESELAPSPGAFKGVEPGDSIEVHWVHTSCAAQPGEGLGSCVPEGCDSPLLRVEAQVYLLVNDSSALDFMDLTLGEQVDGLHQAKALPSNTGDPVMFRGSTTGPSYDEYKCSPVRVTWNVRPQCAKLDIDSLHRWAEAGNVFNEMKAHGVRQLVTAPELLAPIN